MTEANLTIHPTVQVAETAIITASIKGTRIGIGAHTEIYDYVVIKPVGGGGDIIIGLITT